MKLPYMAGGDYEQIRWQESFGGLDMRLGAPGGSIAAMQNMSADHWPVLAPRAPRRKLNTLTAAHGFGGADKLFWVDGTGFYYDGVLKGTVSVGDKRLCCLGAYITIWPDKLFYNTKTGEFGSLEATVSASAAVLSSERSPSGLSSEANCLQMTGASLTAFKAGEAVRISGCSVAADNKTLVIREISGSKLYFYDNSFALRQTASCYTASALAAGAYCFYDTGSEMFYNFTLTEAIPIGRTLVLEPDTVRLHVRMGPEELAVITVDLGRGEPGTTELAMDVGYWPRTETGTVTLSREVPDAEVLCQCDNRLWAGWDNTVGCCYLGNPKIWNNFDDTATACWQTGLGSAGALTGAFSYGGYPLFFKEDRILRVYGTKSANYQLFETETLGCESGCEKSFAVVGQTLIYKSRAGFVAYSGGVPRRIDTALGTARRQDAVAGSDGQKYYVSCRVGSDWSLLVYDGLNALWHREDATQALGMAWSGGELHMLASDGAVWMLGRPRSVLGTQEDAVQSVCEFADMAGAAAQKDAVQRLYFRAEADELLTAEIQYDSSGVWEYLTAIQSETPCVRTVELVPRRCDHFRLRLTGRGEWSLRAIGCQMRGESRM